MSAVGDALTALTTIETILPQLATPTRAGFVIELIRTAFVACDKLDPGEIDEIAAACCNHLRQLRPEQMSPLSLLLEPTEPNVDPRKG